MSVDYQRVAQRLAVIAAAKLVLADLERDAKMEAATLRRGTVVALDDHDVELGKLTVPKPTVPAPQIVDEAAAAGWAIDQFGETSVRMGLSEIGRRDVLAAFAKGVEVPGVVQLESRPATPRFTPSRDVVDLVRGMVARGVLAVEDLPMIGGAA